MNKIVSENDKFQIEVVQSPDVNLKREFYGIRNKDTGMVETYHSTLAEALVELETAAFILSRGISRMEADRRIEGMTEQYFPAREQKQPEDAPEAARKKLN